ncbi:MAG: hypothetical protein ACC608_04125 [Anaerofustis sp.]
MDSKNKIACKAIKSGMAALISGLILLCSVPVQASGSTEKYNYDLKYSIRIPSEYTDNTVSLSAGRLNIQFSDSVYLALTAEKYYDSLSSDEIGNYSEKDFTLGGKALDDTYNNSDYVTQYFEKKLGTIVGNKRIDNVYQDTINGSEFWVCEYVLYTETTDSATNETQTTDVGEGRMYFSMKDGISYFITVNSSNGPLSDAPDAVKTMESFHIGKQLSPAVYVVWTIVIVAILAFLYFLNRHFRLVEVEMEDEDGNTTSLTGLAEIPMPEDDWDEGAWNDQDDTVLLPNIKAILNKQDQDYHKAVKEDPDADEQITQVISVDENSDEYNKKQLLEKLDEMMHRFSHDVTQHSPQDPDDSQA